MKTTGNTILITGGSAGIGLALVKEFAQRDNKIIITGRNQQRLDEVVKTFKNVTAIKSDVSNHEDALLLASQIKKDFPSLNILINNAGVAQIYELGLSTPALDSAKMEMETNYFSVIRLIDLLLPLLNRQENAAIVNMSSIAALRSSKVLPTYAASKAALHFYTQELRNGLAGNTGIQVYEVFPPIVNTDFSKNAGGENGIPPKEVADELIKAFENNQQEVPVGITKVLYQVLEEAKEKLKK